VVLSPAEVDAFFRHVGTLRHRAALMTAYGAGLRVSEVVRLKVSDIDSARMLIRIEQGKGKKDRHAMLSPLLLKVLRAWWRIERPRLAVSRQASGSPHECLRSPAGLQAGG